MKNKFKLSKPTIETATNYELTDLEIELKAYKKALELSCEDNIEDLGIDYYLYSARKELENEK